MAGFRFRMAILLRLRESARDERRAQLATALEAEAVLLAKLRALGEEIAALKRQYKIAAGPGALNIDQLFEAQRYEATLKGDKHTVDTQMQTLVAEIDRRREALVAADKEVRILEKLRDKQRGKFRVEQEQSEMKLLDEIAAMRRELYGGAPVREEAA